MPLIHHTYGKGRVRVMRVYRQGAYNEARDLSVQTMLEGDFSRSWTHGDNRAVVATDTIKNITYIVAQENLQAEPELFGQALARRLLDRYPQAATVRVTMQETRWQRAAFGGVAHPHSFTLDGNGRPGGGGGDDAGWRGHHLGDRRIHVHENHGLRAGRITCSTR